MAEPSRPAATKTYGKKNGIFVPVIASATLAPTVAEITAAGALDFTLIEFADQAFKPTKSTNRAKQNRRWGDTDQYEFIGETSWEGGDWAFQVAAQAAPASAGKKALETFVEGLTGFVAFRLGVTRATTPVAGQFVNVYPVEYSITQIDEFGEGESAEAAGMCSIAITGKPAFNVAILA